MKTGLFLLQDRRRGDGFNVKHPNAAWVHGVVRRSGGESVILEFQAIGCDFDIRFVDWDWPVPRIGERVWLKALMDIAIDDPHWRVEDVWWEPESEDDEPVCVVFLERN